MTDLLIEIIDKRKYFSIKNESEFVFHLQIHTQTLDAGKMPFLGLLKVQKEKVIS